MADQTNYTPDPMPDSFETSASTAVASAAASGDGNVAPGVVDPEGAVTGTPGQTYFNSANSTFWHKVTGSGNTGWIQLI